jgi:thioredoxin 1
MKNSFENLIASSKPILIDFYATWCGPCKMLSPVLKQVKDTLGDRIVILKIDVDKNQELAKQMEVRGVPTLFLYQESKQLWRQSGVLSKEEIINTIVDKTQI